MSVDMLGSVSGEIIRRKNTPRSSAWFLVPTSALFSLTVICGCDVPAGSIDSFERNDIAVNSITDEAEAAAPTTEEALLRHLVEGEFVTATLRLKRRHVGVKESVEVSVELDIAPMWEIHILEAKPKATATQLELLLPDGIQAIGKWLAPEPDRSSSPDGHEVYADKAVFTRVIKITENATMGKNVIRCEIRYQACNERQCMKPTVFELGVPLHID